LSSDEQRLSLRSLFVCRCLRPVTKRQPSTCDVDRRDKTKQANAPMSRPSSAGSHVVTSLLRPGTRGPELGSPATKPAQAQATQSGPSVGEGIAAWMDGWIAGWTDGLRAAESNQTRGQHASSRRKDRSGSIDPAHNSAGTSPAQPSPVQPSPVWSLSSCQSINQPTRQPTTRTGDS
jgi:hypothetical protein